ncbi:MAG: ABC transporter permease [Ruminococcus flavefaciens]|nr:ABC transporter permease [Ruminococcus flavefaciens]MCM1230820.1 ABC transporter permease [Ruminococcus flavefaciens]
MYLRILKKDLKRKKTMNCILLLFVILSAMFSASSVNNIITVSGGLDYYFDKAGMTDYYFIEMGSEDNLSEILDSEDVVTDYKKEDIIFGTDNNFLQDDEKLVEFSNQAVITSIENAKLNYFDSDDNIISDVEEGKVYVSGMFADKAGLETGDTFDFRLGETEITFEMAGTVKDAFLGGEMMGNPRFLINDSDYEKISSGSSAEEVSRGGIFYVNTDDVKALESAVADCSTVGFKGAVSTIKMTYAMSVIVAGALLAVSIFLILVSLLVLRFTIGFTITEEFREIGVMKAVGLKNNSVRGLYLVKYLGISVVGAVIGYIASIPFGNVMLSSVSENMVLGNDKTVLIGTLSSLIIVGIILAFCWNCTAKIKKMSPIDAVRSGQNGERFHKKSLIYLSKSKLKTTGFLALNDILSSPKQYGIITAIFTFCTLLIMILANTANTLNSDKLLFLLGCTKSDVYYNNSTGITEVMQGVKTLDESVAELEKKLADNDMPADVHIETLYQLPVKFGDVRTTVMFQLCNETSTDEYTYTQGTAPGYANEIAISEPVAEKINATIGDTLQLTIDGEEKDYIITALFQSFSQLGESGRLNENVFPSDSGISSSMAYQIDFDDNPDQKEIDSRIEKLKDILGSQQVMNTAEFVNDSTGASEMIAGVKNFVLIVSLIIIILISVLMEHSFISKEKSEIALMKAIGFRSSNVYSYHTARFLTVGLISSVIAGLVCKPLTKLAMDPIFSIMGAVAGISYEIRPVEIYAVYPIIIILATIVGTFLTSLYTRSIKASDTSNIE